ncbi:Inhibitor of nuclear factor kappa-B kinase-interacting protein [Camelus dromedarius]|uniref:Inhibitor of nuclear factor kappa-B kinase-interacting protein n=1 Tax=Camelus dromedarius TaxID=9838 RepID=A0A5N4DGK2_CAMDR|nr:Inhibitor of nuclear factor kappa-B kinase-interacting protein [Camelus dromedarius]
MSEVKSRKKSGLKGAPAEPGKRSEGGKNPEARCSGGGGWVDPRTGVSLLSLGTCLGLAWFVFQQSEKFAKVENQYQLLKMETNEFQGLQSKISLISEKLESTESILQEATSSMSLVTQFEQEVSNLQSIMHDIQNSEEMLTQKMQSLNEKFQNITDFWKRSLEEMNVNTDIFKSESKYIHSQVTAQINSAEQEIKLLTERLKDLEDSTLRNIRTVKRQEEEDLLRVEEQLGSDTKAVEKLEEEQHALFAKDEDLTSKLSSYEPKVEECKTHLPAIESAIRSVLRVSQDLIGTEKKMEDLTLQMFNMEDDMLKAVSEIMEMQKTLEGIQYDNSILKMQNELDVLKGKCQKSEAIIEQLKSFQIITHLKHLQEEIYEVKTWSNRITEKRDILNNNLTTLSQDVTKVNQSTTSMAKDVGLKITTVKTDLRRISGLVADVASLKDSVQELENKIEKVEENTVKKIGDLLSSSIDRTAMLRKTASENSQRINSVKKILSELQSDFNKHTDRFLSLESDRAKVLKTVAFANDLKPKVYNLKKDFSRLEPLINDLTLRIGRLVTDLLQREKEIAFLNEKISNLTIVRAEIKDMKDEIRHISDMG